MSDVSRNAMSVQLTAYEQAKFRAYLRETAERFEACADTISLSDLADKMRMVAAAYRTVLHMEETEIVEVYDV